MNVYYLPTRTPMEPVASEPEWPRLVARIFNAWWRFRLAWAEVRGILRGPHYRLTPEEYVSILGEDSEVGPRSRPRPAHPARVIDFESARLRLRPVPQD